MAFGLASVSGGTDLTTTSDTLIYTAPSGGATVSVTFCNRGASAVNVRLARGTGGSPANGDWELYDQPLQPAGQDGHAFTVVGMKMQSGDKIWARAATANVVSVKPDGVEG
jgi:hypothetical protein